MLIEFRVFRSDGTMMYKEVIHALLPKTVSFPDSIITEGPGPGKIQKFYGFKYDPMVAEKDIPP